MSRQIQKDKKKAYREKELQRKKHIEQMDMPMNKFLNGDTPIAKLIKKHIINHLDPVLIDMRVIKAGIQDLRHYEVVLESYEKQYSQGPILEKNKHGLTMSKEELHQEITEIQNIRIDTKLMNIRKVIVDALLPKIDDVFLPGQFEEFVLDCIDNVKKLGFDLFPEKIELVKIK